VPNPRRAKKRKVMRIQKEGNKKEHFYDRISAELELISHANQQSTSRYKPLLCLQYPRQDWGNGY